MGNCCFQEKVDSETSCSVNPSECESLRNMPKRLCSSSEPLPRYMTSQCSIGSAKLEFYVQLRLFSCFATVTQIRRVSVFEFQPSRNVFPVTFRAHGDASMDGRSALFTDDILKHPHSIVSPLYSFCTQFLQSSLAMLMRSAARLLLSSTWAPFRRHINCCPRSLPAWPLQHLPCQLTDTPQLTCCLKRYRTAYRALPPILLVGF